jgi:hypothetical protein
VIWFLSAAVACGGDLKFDLKDVKNAASIAAADNSLRFVIVFKQGDTYHFCVEPVGPVSRLQNVNIGGSILSQGNVNLAGKAGGSGESPQKGGLKGGLEGSYGTGTTIGADMNVAITQSLAHLYEVGEIMQLAHATTFRLCEAQANGELKSDDYVNLVQHVFNQTSAIMLANATHDAASVLPVLSQELLNDEMQAKELARECADLKSKLPQAPTLHPSETAVPCTTESDPAAGTKITDDVIRGAEAQAKRPPPTTASTGAPDPSVVESWKRVTDIARIQRDAAAREQTLRARRDGVLDLLRTLGTSGLPSPSSSPSPIR